MLLEIFFVSLPLPFENKLRTYVSKLKCHNVTGPKPRVSISEITFEVYIIVYILLINIPIFCSFKALEMFQINSPTENLSYSNGKLY